MEKSAKEMFEELDIHIRNENEYYIEYGLHTKEMLYATDASSFNIYFNKPKKYFQLKEIDMCIIIGIKLYSAITQQMKELGWI